MQTRPTHSKVRQSMEFSTFLATTPPETQESGGVACSAVEMQVYGVSGVVRMSHMACSSKRLLFASKPEIQLLWTTYGSEPAGGRMPRLKKVAPLG